MSKTKTYFYVPGEDYAPDKLIRLGQLITKLKYPWTRLAPPVEPLPEIHVANKTVWEHVRSKAHSGSLGIFTNFAAIVTGIGVDASGHISNEDGVEYAFDKLETFFIEPEPDYVKASIEVPAVKEFLDKNKYTGTSVYMIIGIKIARGASAAKTKSWGRGGTVSATVDITAMTGVPVQFGPKFSLGRTTTDSEAFEKGSDFVFAYRLRKVMVRRSGQFRMKEVTGADLHGLGEEDSDEEDEKGELGDIESVELEDEDFGSDDLPLGFESVAVKDDVDDEDCQCLYLAP